MPPRQKRKDPNPGRSINALAKIEDRHQDLLAESSDNSRGIFVAKWESKSEERRNNRAIMFKYHNQKEELYRQRQTTLQQRRTKLFQLLKKEEAMYGEELQKIGLSFDM